MIARRRWYFRGRVFKSRQPKICTACANVWLQKARPPYSYRRPRFVPGARFVCQLGPPSRNERDRQLRRPLDCNRPRMLSPRPFIAACVFLLTVGFALRELRARELASFVEFVTNNLAGAVSVGNYSRPIRLVSERSAGVQGRNDPNKSGYLHCFPKDFFALPPCHQCSVFQNRPPLRKSK
jgi:hypothetical protein